MGRGSMLFASSEGPSIALLVDDLSVCPVDAFFPLPPSWLPCRPLNLSVSQAALPLRSVSLEHLPVSLSRYPVPTKPLMEPLTQAKTKLTMRPPTTQLLLPPTTRLLAQQRKQKGCASEGVCGDKLHWIRTMTGGGDVALHGGQGGKKPWQCYQLPGQQRSRKYRRGHSRGWI